LVDHIYVSTELSGDFEVDCWEPVAADGTRMSDHPGVVVRLSVDRERRPP
jgi:hypothetical protein